MTTGEPATAEARLGARRGATVVPFARAVGPDGRVVAYEPVPVSCVRLAAVVAAEGLANVTIRPVALAAAPGALAAEGHLHARPAHVAP